MECCSKLFNFEDVLGCIICPPLSARVAFPIGCSDQTQEDALGQQDQCASTSYDPIKDPNKGKVKQILSLEMVANPKKGCT